MKILNLRKKIIAGVTMAALTIMPMTTYAEESIDQQIQHTQQMLSELNARKNQAKSDELNKQLKELTQQVSEMRNQKKYDAEGAIFALSGQIQALQSRIEAQDAFQKQIMASIDTLSKKINTATSAVSRSNSSRDSGAGITSSRFLVNPGPNQNVGYTQDAKNSQGNSTMIFRYSDEQLYKIYCRVGYLTDIILKKGEKIQFVGGGDTSAWAINSSTVDGVPHIYIKPTTETNTTNIIINTDKRSYQIIVNTSDWYNPKVRWSYDKDETESLLKQQAQDAEVITENMEGALTIDSLNFDYNSKVKGSAAFKPVMVLDDGVKTIIKYQKMPAQAPAIFVREQGKKGVNLINFKIKDSCYVLDRIVSEAELRFSDTDIVRITRKSR